MILPLGEENGQELSAAYIDCLLAEKTREGRDAMNERIVVWCGRLNERLRSYRVASSKGDEDERIDGSLLCVTWPAKRGDQVQQLRRAGEGSEREAHPHSWKRSN
jgi:hypothetical protein